MRGPCSCQNVGAARPRFLFVYSAHVQPTYYMSPSARDLRDMAYGRLAPALRKTPLERRLAKGQMSPQHLLQARAAARPPPRLLACSPASSPRPCYASHQWQGLVAMGDCHSNGRRDSAEEDNEAHWAGMTEKIITVSLLPLR